jgi:hypothetical protein
MAGRTIQQVSSQVAQEAVKQYYIAKRNGDPTDVCVEAGMVVAAYLQAQDEDSYHQWKENQRGDCVRQGLSR